MDAFLSHNSQDKPAVEALAQRLQAEGISCWLDKWNLIPGEPWQEAIEEALRTCKSCVVFIGRGEFGPWQNEEMRRAIRRRVEESSDSRMRVIPCVLPGGIRGERSQLPDFLVSTTWVEFRQSLDEEEAFHRLKCGILGIAPGPTVGSSLPEGESPYRGLEAFQAEHAPFYFGRDADVEWLINELRTGSPTGGEIRFLGILGASGSGKSSLARAGLVPAIRKGRQIPGSQSWPIVILRPGANPLESLGVRLAQDDILKVGVADILDFETKMLEDDRRLHLAVAQAVDTDSDEFRRVFVIVDQFEEVFTVCDDEKKRAAFLANLLYAATVAKGRTIVIPAMRADFLPQCAAHSKLAHALSDHQHIVGSMGREALREVIEGPVQLVGHEFEAGLVEMILDDMKKQPPGALPLLEHCLDELWKYRDNRKLTVDIYIKKLGRISGALERHAESIFEGLTSVEQAACARLFSSLVRLGDGSEDTKRQVPIDRLATDSLTKGLVIKLSDKDCRLLSLTTEDKKESLVEITHEALIRNWSRLRRWIDERREALVVFQRLEHDAQEWNDNHRKSKYLYTGARLEEGKNWLKDIGGSSKEYPIEAAFVNAAKARSSRRSQLMAGGTLASFGLALIALWAVEKSLQARDNVRKIEGLQLLELANSKAGLYPETIFYNAKAIGFRGVDGRKDEDYHPRRFPGPSFWTEAMKMLIRYEGKEERLPILIPEKLAEVRDIRLAEMQAYLPIWRSSANESRVEGLEVGRTYLRALSANGSVREWKLGTKGSKAHETIVSKIPPTVSGSGYGVEFEGTTVRLTVFGHKVDLTNHSAQPSAWGFSIDKQVLYVGLENGSIYAWSLGSEKVGKRNLWQYVEKDWFKFDAFDQQLTAGDSTTCGELQILPAFVESTLDLDSRPKHLDKFHNRNGIQFVFIEPGSIEMVDDPHQTTMRGFWIGAFEVTQAEWQDVMRTANPSEFVNPVYPVEKVTWRDCQVFLEKLNQAAPAGWTYRLPTQAEWEFSCRANRKTKYAFGDRITFVDANISNSEGQTFPVGSFDPNDWDIFDMHGNVAEWCQDSNGALKVVRGGAWKLKAVECSSSSKLSLTELSKLNYVGFRPVLVRDRP